MSPWVLHRLGHAVARGAVFGYPTDTVWGLGCHPLIEASVARILEIKNRSADKGLILLSSRLEYCAQFIAADASQLRALQSPAQPPTTWLVPADESCPYWLRGRHPTIAIRITDHPCVRILCEQLAVPLVSTSANRAGGATARNLIQMHKQFADELDFIVSGFETGSGRPSEIKSLASGETVRSSH